MTGDRKQEIRQQLIGYYRSFQNDGEPIAVNFRELVKELSKPERFTHLIHSYPAKLLANIPFFFFASDELCPKNGVVLDPFCGTGTVLLEAALSGRTALGADANPLAELITKVKTNYISGESLTNTLAKVLRRAKLYRRQTEHPEAVAVWYSPSSLKQLSNIQRSVGEIEDERIRPFFELCFSCVARKVSYADPSISVPVHWNPERFSSNPSREAEVKKKLESLKTVDVYAKFEAICKANIARIGTLNGVIREDAARIVSNDAIVTRDCPLSHVRD